jgi:plastocyanin
VTSEDLKTITSPVIKPGQTFEIALTQPGSIPYVCSLHVGMTATLVVR